MSARDRIHAMLPILDSPADAEEREAELDHRLDAYWVEVLNEAAAILRDRAAQYPSRRIFAAGLRQGALLLAKAAMGRGKSSRTPADATPDFFEPGRTYARGQWRFQCLAVAAAPWDEETRAAGFLSRSDGTGTVHGMTADDWAHSGWTDTADPTTTGGLS